MDCCRNIGSDEYLHGAMAGKAGGNTIYNVRCHCVGILFLQIPKTFGKGGIHTAAVLQFSCVELFDCRQYLSTEMGVMLVTPEGLLLTEYNPEFTVEQIQEATEATLIISPELKPMA